MGGIVDIFTKGQKFMEQLKATFYLIEVIYMYWLTHIWPWLSFICKIQLKFFIT
jgi:hypothetical protein